MHEYFKKTASPGKFSEAFKAGMEAQHSTHSGNWDRNPLVAAMLEIKLSLTGHPLDQTTYDTLGMWDRICGGAANIAITPLDHTGAGPAGYRVPTSKQWDPESDTYGDGDVPVTDFSPVVAYGSLEMLRSMRLSEISSCPSGLGHEDALTNQYCENGQEYLVNEMLSRAAYSPFSLQRDVWCNPHSQLTIEQTVGNPEYFDEPLYDTGVQDRFKINNLVVKALERGEEDIEDKAWVKRSLRSWVYVTSSADKQFRAGMYRLIDLPVFRDQPCSTLPNVQCGGGVAFKNVDVAPPIDLPPAILDLWNSQGFRTRTVTTNDDVRLNAAAALVDGIGSAIAWRNGREAVVKYRCSSLFDSAFGFSECERSPYQWDSARPQCSSEQLQLRSNPTFYGSSHWLFRLDPSIASPSPPPPPPNPNPPPAPPSPHPPPSPPRVYTQAEVMADVRKAEEAVCTSVYYLSQTTRCERLAISLTQRWLMTFQSPPSSPPVDLLSMRPPPSPPPSPSMPSGFNFVDPYSATLSTFRMPPQLPAGQEIDAVGFYAANRSTLANLLSTVEHGHRACLAGSPLACASGSMPHTCLNGDRRCGTGEENAKDPYVDFKFRIPDGEYLWGLKIALPVNEQLTSLFVGPKRVEVFAHRNRPLPCAEGNDEVVGPPQDHKLTIVCQPPTFTDQQIHDLSEADRVRITLLGEFRQVWLRDFQVIARTIKEATDEAAPSPPPPPPPLLPDQPASPPSPPDGKACNHFGHLNFAKDVKYRAKHEPCGLTKEECCTHKRKAEDEGAGAYMIDDAGCCTVVFFEPAGTLFDEVAVYTDSSVDNSWRLDSGIGV